MLCSVAFQSAATKDGCLTRSTSIALMVSDAFSHGGDRVKPPCAPRGPPLASQTTARVLSCAQARCRRFLLLWFRALDAAAACAGEQQSSPRVVDRFGLELPTSAVHPVP